MSSHCSGCGRSFKGSRGLAIHRGKTGCGQSNNVFSSSSISFNSVNCDICGKECKGQRGLAIHKAKSKCGSSSSYASSTYSGQFVDLAKCNNCEKQYKGQRGLAIPKAKSECGSSKSYYASSVYSDQSFNYVNCDNCGTQCKGQHGLAIHKAISECGSSRSSYASSTYSGQFVDLAKCNNCEKQYKGQHGLAIPKAKSECGSSKSYYASSVYSDQSFNYVNCDNCGTQCKGQHGLAIHKAISECGSSRSSYASSAYSGQSVDLAKCNNCEKQYKGQRGLAIPKAISECGSSKSSYASSTYSGQSVDLVKCNNCGKECKGQYGLIVHKAKSECRSSKIALNDLSSFSSKSTFQDLNKNSDVCDNCGEKFKGKNGLMIHKAKSRCGRIIAQRTINSIDICRRWLNDLKYEDLFNINYDHSIYDPEERISFVEENIPDETTNSDVSKNHKSIYWLAKNVVLNNKIDKEEQFYLDTINKTIQNSDDWRMDLKTFKDRLQSAFNKDLYIDAEFIVIHEIEKDKVIKGHKLIFALSSPEFRAMFYGSLPENDKIIITDVSPRAMQNILLFLYTNSVVFNSINDAFYTHFAAKKYILNNLQYRTVDYLGKNVNYENSFQIFEYSELMELNDLKKKCEIIMNKNPEKCLRSGYLLNMNLDSVMKIAAWYMERNIQNQLLAEKLVEWSMAECEMQEFHKTEENLISLLEPILDKFNSESFTDLIGNLVRNSSVSQ